MQNCLLHVVYMNIKYKSHFSSSPVWCRARSPLRDDPLDAPLLPVLSSMIRALQLLRGRDSDESQNGRKIKPSHKSNPKKNFKTPK